MEVLYKRLSDIPTFQEGFQSPLHYLISEGLIKSSEDRPLGSYLDLTEEELLHFERFLNQFIQTNSVASLVTMTFMNNHGIYTLSDEMKTNLETIWNFTAEEI